MPIDKDNKKIDLDKGSSITRNFVANMRKSQQELNKLVPPLGKLLPDISEDGEKLPSTFYDRWEEIIANLRASWIRGGNDAEAAAMADISFSLLRKAMKIHPEIEEHRDMCRASHGNIINHSVLLGAMSNPWLAFSIKKLDLERSQYEKDRDKEDKETRELDKKLGNMSTEELMALASATKEDEVITTDLKLSGIDDVEGEQGAEE